MVNNAHLRCWNYVQLGMVQFNQCSGSVGPGDGPTMEEFRFVDQLGFHHPKKWCWINGPEIHLAWLVVEPYPSEKYESQLG